MKTPLERSPYGLIQEDLRDQPWRLLVACMMLNLTNIKQVRPVIWEFFRLYPDPEATSKADQPSLATLLKPLGLYNRRSKMIIRFSMEYAQGGWCDVKKLPGVGTYASDSYEMFVIGNLNIEPTDSKLKKYKEWALGRENASRNEMHQTH